MSKKAQKRQRRRQQQGYALSDARRDYLAHLERRGRGQTTPAELRWQSVTEPFYLRELGLHRAPFETRFPHRELPPIIRRES